MLWYYAGPDAKPVGPISLEELQARRGQGAIKPDTYIIEQTGQPIESLTWKKYQDVFPATSSLPPVPPPAAIPGFVPPPAPQAHPLFPSATPGAVQPPAYPNPARPDPYYNVKPTNGWCGWGFGIGITAFLLSFACGLGFLPALLAIILCSVGLVKVNQHREQAGLGLGVAGLIFAVIALLISGIFIWTLGLPLIKAHELTVTEQTSNDSE